MNQYEGLSIGDAAQSAAPVSAIHTAGAVAILSGIVSAIGVVFFIAMLVFFTRSNDGLGLKFGLLNDICVALQYLLAVPIALALNRIMAAYNPALMRFITITGILALLITVGLQLLLIFGVLTFEQQFLWIALSIILGIGSWLVITGLTARATGRLPHSFLMSVVAVSYFGYPIWAFWLGRRLLGW